MIEYLFDTILTSAQDYRRVMGLADDVVITAALPAGISLVEDDLILLKSRLKQHRVVVCEERPRR